jgi:hypothetical protein
MLVSKHKRKLADSNNRRGFELLGHPFAHPARHDPESGAILDQIEGFARGRWLLYDPWPEAGTFTLLNDPFANLGVRALRGWYDERMRLEIAQTNGCGSAMVEFSRIDGVQWFGADRNLF